MKDKIIELMETKPKHFSQMIKRNDKMVAFVEAHSEEDCKTYAERVYQSVNGIPTTCPNGKRKKFRSATEGYVFCGPASKCQCARDSVSESVSKTKAKRTTEQIDAENKKREDTFKKKYGVNNAGRLEQAVEAHASFYADSQKVAEATAKNKESKKKNHGDENYNNREQAKETSLDLYGVDNPMKDSLIAFKSSEIKRNNFSPATSILKRFNEVKERISERFHLKLLVEPKDYIGVISRPVWDFECEDCGHAFTHRYDASNYPCCKQCHPTIYQYKSKPELEIYDFIKENTEYHVISGDRSIINPYEIDIHIPKANLAIEFCGLYWHSELSSGRDYQYHARKHRLMKEKGVQLITIFSDEYEAKPEVVRNTILNKLNAHRGGIYARKTAIGYISKDVANNFLDTYHIQGGSDTHGIHLGLFHKNTLVAVNTFRHLGKQHFELSRFASSERVVGGASKLLKRFIADHSPKSIKTFADNRWSDGALYDTLGFTYDGDVPPMQHYVENYTNRYHKLRFRKDKLVAHGYDGDKSEWEIMQELGFDRIWDCGKRRYMLYPK